MLIIFDLDDTLIDTSGAVTPFKLRCFLQRLFDLQLISLSFDQAHEELFHLNQNSPRSKDAVDQFLAHHSIQKEKAEPALIELNSPLPKNFFIPTTPHAMQILEFFHSSHPLALVTGGFPPFQREKMEKAGIEPAFFSKIEIPRDCVKKPVYESLIREFSISPSDVWVCGDRVALDLAPAKELGMRTIHMQWGRGARYTENQWTDHRISDLRELKEIIR